MPKILYCLSLYLSHSHTIHFGYINMRLKEIIIIFHIFATKLYDYERKCTCGGRWSMLWNYSITVCHRQTQVLLHMLCLPIWIVYMWKGVSDSKEEAPIVPSTNNYLAFGSSMQECSLIFWSTSLIMHFCLVYVAGDMVHIVCIMLHVANMISA